MLENLLQTKELVPILIASAVWGHEWQGSVVKLHSDNMAVVEVVNTGYSKHPRVQYLLHCLFYIVQHLTVWYMHIPGVENGGADAISRNNNSFKCIPKPTLHRPQSWKNC